MQTGSTSRKKRGGNKRSLVAREQKDKICEWVDEECTLTLNELKERVSTELGAIVSKSTIDRCLKKFHYSLKKVSIVPARRNIDTTIDDRERYALEFRSLEESVEDKNQIFIDKVGFAVVFADIRSEPRRQAEPPF